MERRTYVILTELSPATYGDVLRIHVSALDIPLERVVLPIHLLLALANHGPERHHSPAVLKRWQDHSRSPVVCTPSRASNSSSIEARNASALSSHPAMACCRLVPS